MNDTQPVTQRKATIAEQISAVHDEAAMAAAALAETSKELHQAKNHLSNAQQMYDEAFARYQSAELALRGTLVERLGLVPNDLPAVAKAEFDPIVDYPASVAMAHYEEQQRRVRG